jgi:hypothetical protein
MREAVFVATAFALAMTMSPALPASARPDQPQAPTPVAIRSSAQAAAAMECDADQQGCTRPREYARKFRQGRYGKYRARRDLNWPRTLRRRATNAIIRKSRAFTRHERRAAWRSVSNHDTCVVPQFQGDVISHPNWDCTSARRLKKRRLSNADVHVLNLAGSGWMILLAWKSGGPLAAVGSGWFTTYWERFLRFIQRNR